MKKLTVNDREYAVESTEFTCQSGKIVVAGRYEIEIDPDADVYFDANPEHLRIKIPSFAGNLDG